MTDDLGVDARLANAPRYQLCVLGAEVDDQDGVDLTCGILQRPIPTPWECWSALPSV